MLKKKKNKLTFKKAKPHRCKKCGVTVVTNVCVACEIKKLARNLKRSYPKVTDFDLELEPEQYARYLEVRHSLGLPLLEEEKAA